MDKKKNNKNTIISQNSRKLLYFKKIEISKKFPEKLNNCDIQENQKKNFCQKIQQRNLRKLKSFV